jgi:hypothetical protein
VAKQGAVMTVVIANRHSPVPVTANLTASQVDRLIATALGNLSFTSDNSDRAWPQCAARTWPDRAGRCGTLDVA